MDLSVILVSYNVRHFLEEALYAVEQALEGLQAEIIVVDNASVDDSVAMVRSRFPHVRLMANQDNTGFAVANNQAIRQASGRYILLLNPDTVVGEDAFHKCLAFMDAHPDAGALGARMIDGGGQFLPESKRGFPTPFAAFCKAFGLSRLFPRSSIFNRYYLGHLSQHQTVPVDVLAGAFMFMRREALDRAGLLDEQFFMYGEDIDLSFRIQQSGFVNYYFPDVTIIHYKGESTRRGSLQYIRIFYQAMILFARKYFHGPSRQVYIALIQWAIYFRASLSVGYRLLRRGWLLAADTAILYGSILLIKDFWAQYYFNDPDYYPSYFHLVNAPLYTGIWLLSLYLSGAWDRPFDLWSAARGILAGTLGVAAIYGFLDDPYRTSRAIILISTAAALAGTLLLRMTVHYFRTGHLFAHPHRHAALIVVGKADECTRAEDLLLRMDRRKNLIGRIDPDNGSTGETVIGSMRDLDQIVRLFDVDEILFCGRDVRAAQIIGWMDAIGTGPDYRILPAGGQSIIGSTSASAAGDPYTLDIRFRIADPLMRRHKRMLDVLLGFLMLPLAPVLLWFQRSPSRYLGHAFALMTGTRTLVAYESRLKHLPQLTPGIFRPEAIHPDVHMDQAVTDHLSFLYARDYELVRDIRIFIRNIRRLDRP